MGYPTAINTCRSEDGKQSRMAGQKVLNTYKVRKRNCQK